MAKSTQPKNAAINVKLNKVFAGQSEDLKGTLVGVFSAVNNMQMGTPGEKARFEEALEVVKNAQISVSDAEIKIVTTPQNAEIIARGLAVPNDDGSLDTPSVEEVLDPQKLEALLMRSIAHTEAFKTVMTNMSAMKDGKVKEADEKYYQALAQVESAMTEANQLRKINTQLKTQKKTLEEANAGLVVDLAKKTTENEKLYKEANYITKSGKAYPVKPATRVAGMIFAGILALSVALNVGQAVRGRNLANQNEELRKDYSTAQQTIDAQNTTIKGLQNSILDYQDQVDDLHENINGLQDQIDSHYEKYQAVVELAQNAGFTVANDIKIEDLFMAIIDGVNNGQATDGAQVAYARIAQIMQEYGITEEDLTGKDGKYDPSKVEAEIREAFTEALVSAKTIADTEKAVAGLLEGTGKKLSDFKSMAGAIAYAQEYNEIAMDTLNAKIEAQEATIEAKEARIAELERQVANNTGDPDLVAKLQGEIADLKDDLKDAKDELSETKATLATTQAAYAELTGDYNDLDSAYDAIVEEYNDAQDTISNMNGVIAGLRAENKDLEGENAVLKKENEDLKEENERLEGVIAGMEDGEDSVETPSNPGTDNSAGNVNVGETDPDDDKNNPGQEDVPIATPGDSSEKDPNKGAQPGEEPEDGSEGELGEE